MRTPKEPAHTLYIPVDDPRVPQVLRKHAARFDKPGCVLMTDGPNGYPLFAEDGEPLDMLTGPALLRPE